MGKIIVVLGKKEKKKKAKKLKGQIKRCVYTCEYCSGITKKGEKQRN